MNRTIHEDRRTWTCETCHFRQFLGTPCNCEGPGTPDGAHRIHLVPLPVGLECGAVWNGQAVTRIDRAAEEVDLMDIRAFANFFAREVTE